MVFKAKSRRMSFLGSAAVIPFVVQALTGLCAMIYYLLRRKISLPFNALSVVFVWSINK